MYLPEINNYNSPRFSCSAIACIQLHQLADLSPGANAIILYLSNAKAKVELLKKFWKHKIGGGCIYIQKLEDFDTDILKK